MDANECEMDKKLHGQKTPLRIGFSVFISMSLQDFRDLERSPIEQLAVWDSPDKNPDPCLEFDANPLRNIG